MATPASDRGRNRKRLEKAEQRLGRVQGHLEQVIYHAGRAHDEVYRAREEMRETLGMDPPKGVAPLYEAAQRFELPPAEEEGPAGEAGDEKAE